MKTWAIMMFIMFMGLWMTPLGFLMAAGFTAFAAVSSIPLALSAQGNDAKELTSSTAKLLKELGN